MSPSWNPPWDDVGQICPLAVPPPMHSPSRANHPFVVGKRVFGSTLVLLGLNGIDFDLLADAGTAMTLGIAADEIDADGLARWIEDNLPDALGPEP